MSCAARYEMRILDDQGDQPVDNAFIADARPTGTPWANVDKSQARVACDALGFGYQLITNVQWQAVARSVEQEPSNWSGGAVGAGALVQVHRVLGRTDRRNPRLGPKSRAHRRPSRPSLPQHCPPERSAWPRRRRPSRTKT